MRTNTILLLGALLVAAGCGGGSGPGEVLDIEPDPEAVSVDLPADAANSGSVAVGIGVLTGSNVIVGDSLGDMISIGFYRFDLSSLPAGATIVDAQLTTGLDQVIGVPFAQFGSLVVDHVDLGVDLDETDVDTPALEPLFGTLAADGALEAKTLDVTAQVQADLVAARTTSDFRMYFEGTPDGENDDDYVYLTNTGHGGTVGVEPVLTVSYLEP